MSDSLVKRDNYVTIPGWALCELNLKGNELTIFSIIHGFSQSSQGVFNGSLQYLADWTNSTRRGVLKNLKSLLEKGLIQKRELQRGNVKFCEYVSKFTSGEQSSQGGEQSSHNNIVNTINSLSHEYSVTYKEEKTKKFLPPSLEEIQKYIDERNSNVDAHKFYDYYSVSNWCDSKGNKVKSWKQKLITWEKQNPKKAEIIFPTKEQGDWNSPGIRELFE